MQHLSAGKGIGLVELWQEVIAGIIALMFAVFGLYLHQRIDRAFSHIETVEKTLRDAEEECKKEQSAKRDEIERRRREMEDKIANGLKEINDKLTNVQLVIVGLKKDVEYIKNGGQNLKQPSDKG